jgi:eukaryotic-like serine/threonine-protein kinase
MLAPMGELPKAGRQALGVEETVGVGDTVDAGVVADTISRDGGALAAEPRPLRSFRQYELIRELGRGGMGRVFLARDVRLGRRVAIKLLIGGSSENTERVLAEARATAQCNHENIVVIHEADEHEGQPYMVLEYLEGATLRQQLGGRPLAVSRAVELMVPVVRALIRAHEHGIVHRDLKPENIFLTASGTIKVLDFGLAKPFAAGAAQPENAIAGTLPYMAPEQLLLSEMDHRTDQWAVGVMLFEMVAGHHPLHPYTPSSLMRSAAALDEPMPRLSQVVPQVPDALEAAVERCLKKRKAERFDDPHRLLDELEPLVPRRFGRRLAEDESPYPGLSAFQEADADRFFGRADEVARVAAQLRNQPMVCVAGPSGVGKSSFVRAGVVPALKASGEAWEIVIVRPGRNPLQALAGALQPLDTSGVVSTDREELVEKLRAQPGFLGAFLRQRALTKERRIVLYVDQMEELYTLSADAAPFTECLCGAADDPGGPLRVLASIRSDFLDRTAENRRFSDELMRGLVFLSPLGAGNLREALLQPLEVHGYRMEAPEMVSEMVDALAASPGALPLLQFTAAKLWEARDRRQKVLTRESYASMGGILGALATHAEAVIAGLAPATQKLARALLPRLVTPEGTRAAPEVAELAAGAADPAEVRALVDTLVAARLLVVSSGGESEGAAVELVHESLIAGWPTLRRWLDEGREDATFLTQLRAAARQWSLKNKSNDLLWRGEAMEEARLWRARYKGELPPRDAEYLDAVFTLAGRAARIRRALVAGTIGFLLLVVGVGAVALVSIRRAERHAVDEAGRATREAERARTAEGQIKDQLDVIKNEEAAKQRAQAEVVQGKEDLRSVNAQLKGALGKAEDESKHAQAEATRAQQLSQSMQLANQKLEKLLSIERARAAELERERKKITTELK